MIKLDDKQTKGCHLDEIKSHLFIEKSGAATTWVKFRDVMRKIDKDYNNHMSLTEFFIFIHKRDWKDLIKRDTVYDKAAQDALDEANAALDQSRAAMMEVKAGLAKIQEEEDKKARYIAKKKAIADDTNLSTVKRGKAFNEMKQAEAEDPLPLRKAKLEQKAAVRRAIKAVNAASKIGILNIAVRNLNLSYIAHQHIGHFTPRSHRRAGVYGYTYIIYIHIYIFFYIYIY